MQKKATRLLQKQNLKTKPQQSAQQVDTTKHLQYNVRELDACMGRSMYVAGRLLFVINAEIANIDKQIAGLQSSKKMQKRAKTPKKLKKLTIKSKS